MTDPEKILVASICPAIQARNMIKFWYENSTGSQYSDWHVVEPYILGVFNNGSVQLSAWVLPTPEQAERGKKEAWRSYILKNVSKLEVLGQFQKARPDFDPKATGMREIFCAGKRDAFMRIA
jgi:hypothetical protein